MPPSASDSDSDSEPFFVLPEEPASYRAASPEPTCKSHTLSTAPHEQLQIHFVGNDPLWGHMLWNAGVVMSQYLETHAADLLKGRTVLELGAGGGLPSLTCGLRGAKQVVVTDYPDAALVANLRKNVAEAKVAGVVAVEGYLWGAEMGPLLEYSEGGFDVVLLSDLLFNHSEHEKLVASVKGMLKRSEASRALVFFTPHRPWLYEKDLDFFRLVAEHGFEVEKLFEKLLDAPMFEEDRGDRDLRRTVFGYELRWKAEELAK